jgi:hypothetical protein
LVILEHLGHQFDVHVLDVDPLGTGQKGFGRDCLEIAGDVLEEPCSWQ